MLYQQGYFRQYLNEAGWQQEAYVDNDFHNLRLHLERRADGAPVTISVGYTVRVIPYNPSLTSPFLPGMIVWA